MPDRNGKIFYTSITSLSHISKVGEHTHHGNYEVYYFLSGRGVYRSNGETTTVDAGTVTFTGDGESHFLRNDGPEPLEFMAFVLNLPAQA